MNSRISTHTPFLLDHIKDFEGQKVLIVGDIGLDEYVLGQVRRISPEAPVPIVEVETEESRLGLAANVAQNIAGLGGIPVMISVVGADGTAERLRELLSRAGVQPDHLLVDLQRPTTRKLRVMVQNHHIVRVDYERRQFISAQIEASLLRRVYDCIDDAASVIVQDYAKGVISERLIREVVAIAHARGKKVLADPHRNSPLSTYHGVDIMTPNYEEAVALSGIPVDDLRADPKLLNRIGEKVMAEIGASQLVITRGKEGMRLFENRQSSDMPTFARQVADVTGAGDTVIAALALGWGAGFSLERACALANFAAGVVVGKIGCAPCTVAELTSYMHNPGDT